MFYLLGKGNNLTNCFTLTSEKETVVKTKRIYLVQDMDSYFLLNLFLHTAYKIIS